MKLNLAIEDKVLASVNLDPTVANNEYYLKAFRRRLSLRYQNKIRVLKNSPRFYLEQGAEQNGRSIARS